MKSKKLFWLNAFALATILIVEFNLTGCGKIDGLPVTAATPSIPGIPIAPPPPPVGVVNDSEGFYVINRTSPNYTYVNHKGNTTMSEPCRAASGELINCYVEGQELDLFYNGVELQYNLPTTLCTYFRLRPYYYFSQAAGSGPSSAQLDTDSNGVTGRDGDSSGIIGDDGSDSAYSSVACQYDYTPDGPNCCGGRYTYTTRSWNPDLGASGGYEAASVPNVSWGGTPANCLSGPAMKTQSKDTAGRPVNSLSYVGGTGVNSTYSGGAPIENGKGGNVHVANYYDAASFAAADSQLPNSLLGLTPTAFHRVDANGVAFVPQPFYDFQCLDASEEFIAQILVQVRSWSRKSNFLDLVANPGLYQISGAEPAPWNTLYDIFDRGNWHAYRTIGGFSTGYPGLGE